MCEEKVQGGTSGSGGSGSQMNSSVSEAFSLILLVNADLYALRCLAVLDSRKIEKEESLLC